MKVQHIHTKYRKRTTTWTAKLGLLHLSQNVHNFHHHSSCDSYETKMKQIELGTRSSLNSLHAATNMSKLCIVTFSNSLYTEYTSHNREKIHPKNYWQALIKKHFKYKKLSLSLNQHGY